MVFRYDGVLLCNKEGNFYSSVEKWIHLETIMLNKVSQKHKIKYYMVSLI